MDVQLGHLERLKLAGTASAWYFLEFGGMFYAFRGCMWVVAGFEIYSRILLLLDTITGALPGLASYSSTSRPSRIGVHSYIQNIPHLTRCTLLISISSRCSKSVQEFVDFLN